MSELTRFHYQLVQQARHHYKMARRSAEAEMMYRDQPSFMWKTHFQNMVNHQEAGEYYDKVAYAVNRYLHGGAINHPTRGG